MTELQRLTISRKEGEEQFHVNGNRLGFDLLSFWQWASSDLVSNATRGVIAEYIVAWALGLTDKDVREEWAAFDMETPSGIKVEVKSSAYVQSWSQKTLSSISFATPKTRAWDADTNTLSKESKRQADVYVFALLAHKDKATIDPLNIEQWCFYVLPTSVLGSRTRSQHSSTLKSLKNLCSGATPFNELLKVVESCKPTATSWSVNEIRRRQDQNHTSMDIFS